jgi:two-component system CheB/CheR fusion protein
VSIGYDVSQNRKLTQSNPQGAMASPYMATSPARNYRNIYMARFDLMLVKATDVANEGNTRKAFHQPAAQQLDAPKADSPFFPIVGIGASAGGLAAFEAFFRAMPVDVDPGMAFVLVQHLAPDHKSLLSELIGRCTRLKVFEVKEGMPVAPNCAYIIPPNSEMAFERGVLRLTRPTSPRGKRLPIDFFFLSLARELRHQAICIVLSGTGSDGTAGLRAIKSAGGLVIAQDPDSCEYDGMPRSAIATGLVDYQLSPQEMPTQLIAYLADGREMPTRRLSAVTNASPDLMNRIFVQVHSHTGHDFSQYKPNTISRVIQRRMASNQIETIEKYVEFVEQSAPEADDLFAAFLIGVTRFFRDPKAFAALGSQVLSNLFSNKPGGGNLRIWCPGCSTGEEAYSLAILLQEHLEATTQDYRVQVFATDIDSQAITTARAGRYPASISADVSPARLARFFDLDPDGRMYRVQKNIRDMLVFSEQDAVRDPPFSRIDLISCRNLLIYMGQDLQKKMIPLFHYALNSGGFLFLGSSESVGDFSDLFSTIDSKHKLYHRNSDFHTTGRGSVERLLPRQAVISPLVLNSGPPTPQFVPQVARLSLRELTEQTLLLHLAPAGALINSQGDILYLFGRTGKYLEPSPGEAGVNNILKMSRDGLRTELTMALHKSLSGNEIVRVQGLRIPTSHGVIGVNLTIRPIDSGGASGPNVIPAAKLYLLILEESPPAELLTTDRPGDTDSRIVALKEELSSREEYIQTANQRLAESNEDFRASHVHMQSANEQLQSTNEELETSEEELQSVNEELATVNAELQTKVMDLSRANNDMNNLLAGTGIATVFVNQELQIMRFTPAATRIINLIEGDLGRPLGDIVAKLVGYDRMIRDAQTVLDTLGPKEVEVQTVEGNWYVLRMLPYRTLNNVVEGVVITFVDITEIKRAEDALRKANDLNRLAVVVRDARDAITVADLDGRILAWNPAAVRIYGWSEAEALSMNVREMIPEALREKAMIRSQHLGRSEILEPYSTQRIAKDGTVVQVQMTSTALLDASNQMYATATTERAKDSKRGQVTEVQNEKAAPAR